LVAPSSPAPGAILPRTGRTAAHRPRLRSRTAAEPGLSQCATRSSEAPGCRLGAGARVASPSHAKRPCAGPNWGPIPSETEVISGHLERLIKRSRTWHDLIRAGCGPGGRGFESPRSPLTVACFSARARDRTTQSEPEALCPSASAKAMMATVVTGPPCEVISSQPTSVCYAGTSALVPRWRAYMSSTHLNPGRSFNEARNSRNCAARSSG
jgi:hypothetical protein